MAQSGTQIAGVRETRKGATIYKTNERPGTRAQVRYVRVSAYKAREVLNLIRDLHVEEADQVLAFTERDISNVIRKALASAVANATNNDSQDPETLKVVSAYADEGPTLKRWRPRARGRATRIRKRTCHITIIVARMSDTELSQRNRKAAASGAKGTAASRASRRDRVAKSRKAEEAPMVEEAVTDEVATEETAVEEITTEAVEAEETEAEAPAAETEEETTTEEESAADEKDKD